MHYVTQYGYIWRLSLKQYKLLLQTISEGKQYDLRTFGKQLNGRHHEVCDLSPEQAKARLLNL